MIQYNGSMNLGILQNRIQQGLQSKSQTAKKMATALNSNLQAKIAHKAQLEQDLAALKDDDGLISLHAVPAGDHRYLYEAMTDDGKPVSFSSGINESKYYFSYNAPSEKFPNKNIDQTFIKPGYYYGGKMHNPYNMYYYNKNPYLNMYYCNRNSGLFDNETEGLRMVSNEDNSKSMVSKTFDSSYMGFLNSQIPLPALKTENGETKTTFISLGNSDCYLEPSLKSVFDSQINVENIDVDESIASKMYDLANTINDNSLEKAKEFKKQFNMIDFFQNNKDEVFNKPVELATKAYDELKDKPDTPIGTLEIMDLPETVDGERIEFARQGDVFNINFYNEDNKLSMKGTFKILKDENGVPLKEDEDGKIVNQNDENYNNPQNKLCFNMKLSTYHQDLGVKSFDFERNINLFDAKHRQNIEMSRYDRNGAFVREEEASSPKYSENWLKRRICKVWHNTYKTDLKEAKANFEHDMLNPNDLDPSLKNGD